jgi:hypothetical protein
MTVHFTTRSSDDPLASSSRLMFSSACFVSPAIPPGTIRAALSVPSWPES